MLANWWQLSCIFANATLQQSIVFLVLPWLYIGNVWHVRTVQFITLSGQLKEILYSHQDLPKTLFQFSLVQLYFVRGLRCFKPNFIVRRLLQILKRLRRCMLTKISFTVSQIVVVRNNLGRWHFFHIYSFLCFLIHSPQPLNYYFSKTIFGPTIARERRNKTLVTKESTRMRFEMIFLSSLSVAILGNVDEVVQASLFGYKLSTISANLHSVYNSETVCRIDCTPPVSPYPTILT